MKYRGKSYHAWLLSSAAATAIMWAGSAAAEDAQFNIAPQPLASALNEFSLQSKQSVLFTTDLAATKSSQGVNGQVEVADALSSLLAGTGLTYRRNGNTFLIVSASDPQSGSAAGDGADNGTVQALIVTAQKREENIQDVPIAMSAFTQEELTRSQVAGGPDLITQVPNMTFTKTNFSSYSIQIRGIGTQAISATTDAAVAVAFNNTPFIRNRFFEQEFYDLQRVEVLRGPQGTLYGRNATAGVVNLISHKPTFSYEAKVSGDLGNYGSHRLEGMVNVPLVEDKVALRLAGAWTKRDGYDTNQITGNPIDGRDLWSTRLSLRVAPTDRLEANLIWEHFEEDDDRLRSGKQLCHTDEVTNISGHFPDGTPFSFDTTHYQTLPEAGQALLFAGVQGTFSQGCAPASLYAPESFETPNGLSLPYYGPAGFVGAQLSRTIDDPYVSRTQSRDLRVIESTVDPIYRAKTDLGELQVSLDLTDNLTLVSETGYGADRVFSMEDYNRFNTAPGAFEAHPSTDPAYRDNLVVNGVFCDPQVGCADRLVALDLSTAESRQFSQEFRVSSDYNGPFNFSLGANFLRYDTEDKYYVFVNTLGSASASSPSAASEGRQSSRSPLPPYIPNQTDNQECLKYGYRPPDINHGEAVGGCQYLDPNPITSLNDLGHNYFLSKNPYKLISYAVFGESYYNITDKLKLTAGLRWTVDKKEAPLIPSWLLAADTVGYPVVDVNRQEWREPTGRLAIDWKPNLSFTDTTLVYASYAHGYKAGGANPPPAGIVCGGVCGITEANLSSVTHPRTFDAEYVNAYELGSKNTLLDGRLTLNLASFYYDYTGYQISQIVDRSAINMNFDAKVWGLELESEWRPVENLRLGLKLGYEKTRVADGAQAVDTMDRTAGHADWVVVRPFPTFPSNCILPAWLFVGDSGILNGSAIGSGQLELQNLGNKGGGGNGGCELAYVLGYDPVTALPYVANPTVNDAGGGGILRARAGYPGWDPATAPNNGAGFFKDLSGNELPNAPHYTATLTVDYTLPLPSDWLLTLHTDLYYQSESWARIFNTPGYDKLKAYNNVNFAAIFANEDAGWRVMAYVKNVFDKANITGAFLNSDDTGLTTNVFLTEPRLYGLRVTKEFSGGPWWTGADPNHVGPYPLSVEIGGQVQRQDAPHEPFDSTLMGNLPQALDVGGLQDRRLDWGDGRSLRLTLRPDGPGRFISAGIRYGRTNNDTARRHKEMVGEKVCGISETGPNAWLIPYYCNPQSPYYNPGFVRQPVDWSDVATRDAEEHTIVDFNVGADVGVGGLAESSVSAGIRYGAFTSKSSMTSHANANAVIANGWVYTYTSNYDSSVTAYNSELDATREFKGAGPTLTWDAAKALWGDEEAGRLSVDWTVTAGVLFGRQTTSFTGEETSGYYKGPERRWPPHLVGEKTFYAPPVRRSSSVTAPVVDLSLGLSYDVGRFKAGAGYRWERYFNVLDTGYGEHKDADRTIDGPYFKIAVGFGG